MNLAHSVSCGIRRSHDISESRKGRQMRLRVIMPTISGPLDVHGAPNIAVESSVAPIGAS